MHIYKCLSCILFNAHLVLENIHCVLKESPVPILKCSLYV